MKGYCTYHKCNHPLEQFSKRGDGRNGGLQSWCKEARHQRGDKRMFTKRTGETRKKRVNRPPELVAYRRIKTLVDGGLLPHAYELECVDKHLGECSNHLERDHPFGYAGENALKVEIRCRKHHKLKEVERYNAAHPTEDPF